MTSTVPEVPAASIVKLQPRTPSAMSAARRSGPFPVPYVSTFAGVPATISNPYGSSAFVTAVADRSSVSKRMRFA